MDDELDDDYELEDDEELDMENDSYRDLLKLLNEEIYKYAKQRGIDLDDEEKLIAACNSMKKIKLGKGTTEMLLPGIMQYDVGDKRVLKFIDLEGVSFADQNVRRVDFRGTNANVDPQTVEDKNIEGANFEGMDMSSKSFNGCVIHNTNLSYTNAKINPQKVDDKSLADSKFDGLDLSNADFTGIYVSGASFKNAKINLDPQKVWGKNLEETNLENVDMSGKDFSGCCLRYCNLTNTHAVLDLRYLNMDNLWGSKLKGTTLMVDANFKKEQLEQLEERCVELGLVRLDDYTLAKQKIKSVFKNLNEQ